MDIDIHNEVFNQLSLLEKNILGKNMHSLIGKYLSISDNRSFISITKNINNNTENKLCFNHLLKKKSCKIICNFMLKIRKFIENITEDIYYTMYTQNTLTKKYFALYYFKFYENRYIYSWYNGQDLFKKSIIDKYKIKITDSPTKFDLFNLIKRMNIYDVYYIGW